APKAYVRRCARNAAIDALCATADVLVTAEDLEALASRCHGDPGAATGRDRGEGPALRSQVLEPEDVLMDQRLIAACRELSPIERLIIIISIQPSPPPTSQQIAQQIASTHGFVSASSVRGHRMRAIKKLRDIFELPDDQGSR